VLPIGKAKVMRQGTHVTITAHSKMVGFSLAAAEKLAAEGIEAEVGRGGRSRFRGFAGDSMCTCLPGLEFGSAWLPHGVLYCMRTPVCSTRVFVYVCLGRRGLDCKSIVCTVYGIVPTAGVA
jgi:hypothetical protein